MEGVAGLDLMLEERVDRGEGVANDEGDGEYVACNFGSLNLFKPN